jgi:hypothetical protein
MPRRIPMGIGLLTAVVAVAAGTFALVGAAGPKHPQLSTGSPAADALLAAEVAKLPEDHITAASLGSPSSGDVDSGIPDRGNNWLWIKAQAEDQLDAVAAEFDASFLAVDFERKASRAGIVDLTGATVDVYGPAGEILEEGGWAIPRGDDVPPVRAINRDVPAAMAAVRRRLAKGAESAGASLRSVTFRTDLPRLTVDATVVVTQPAMFVATSTSRISAILGDDSGYDGRILRVLDSRGNPVMAVAMNYPLRSGEDWVAPEYDVYYREGHF